MATIASFLAGSKRRHGDDTADSNASSAIGRHAGFESIKLDNITEKMTVEQYLKHQLAVNEEKVADTADDATDALMSTFKTHKEELRDDQHARKLATAVPSKGKAAAKLVRSAVNVELKVLETCSEQADMVGTTVTLTPRQCHAGMVKVGRSTAADFNPPQGLSLSRDSSVSTWHGKFACIWGVVYFTDFSKNGTRLNDEMMPKDTPVALASGDTLTIGSAIVEVTLVPVVEGGGKGSAPGSAKVAADTAAASSGSQSKPKRGPGRSK